MTHSTDTPAASGETGAAQMRANAANVALAERKHNAIEADDPTNLREMKVVAMATAQSIYDEILALPIPPDPHAARIAALMEALCAIRDYKPREVVKDEFAYDRMVGAFQDAARAALACIDATQGQQT